MRNRRLVQAFFDDNPEMLFESSSCWACPLAAYDRYGAPEPCETTVLPDHTVAPHSAHRLLHSDWEMDLIWLIDAPGQLVPLTGSYVARLLREQVPTHE